MDSRPTKIELAPQDRLRITWSDGQLREYSVRQLREECPCATCNEKRKAPPKPAPLLQVLSLQEAQPLKLAGLKPVGSYAYSIEFSDGHDTGIFTLEFLRELGEPVSQ